MSDFQKFEATVINKGGEQPSKIDGSMRMPINIQFDNGATASVWGGGNNLQEMQFLRTVPINSRLTVVQKFNQKGEPKYYVDSSMYDSIQIAPQPTAPGMPAPAGLTGQVGSTGPMSTSPPHVAPPPPPPPADYAPRRSTIQPLGENALLHASMRMEEAEKVYRLAHKRAADLVHELYEFQFSEEDPAQFQTYQSYVARMATTFFLESTPWKLSQEGFEPSEYNHPVFGHTLRTPLTPEKLVDGLRKRAEQEPSIDKETLNKMKALAAMGLERLFGSEVLRHKFGEVVFGKESIAKWTPGEINAVVSWMNTGKDVNYVTRPDVAIEAYLLREMF